MVGVSVTALEYPMEPIRDLTPQTDILLPEAKVYCLPLDPLNPAKKIPLVIEITTTGLSRIHANPDTFKSGLEEMQEALHCKLSVRLERLPSPCVRIKGCCSRAITHMTLVESGEALVWALRIFLGLNAKMLMTTT